MTKILKIYEIIKWSDGGPNDKGTVISYQKALNKSAALQKAARALSNNEIMTLGFFSAHEITYKKFLSRKKIAESELNLFKNI